MGSMQLFKRFWKIKDRAVIAWWDKAPLENYVIEEEDAIESGWTFIGEGLAGPTKGKAYAIVKNALLT